MGGGGTGRGSGSGSDGYAPHFIEPRNKQEFMIGLGIVK